MKRAKPAVQNDNSSHWTTAEKALEHLRSGMRVFVGSGCAAPQKLVAALAVALVQASSPDSHGFCSFGVSVEVVKAAVESADYVVAEVNPNTGFRSAAGPNS